MKGQPRLIKTGGEDLLLEKFKMILPCCKQLWLLISPMGILLGDKRPWFGHQLAMWTWLGHYISLSQISFLIYQMGKIIPVSPKVFWVFVKIIWDSINKVLWKITILKNFNLYKHPNCNKKLYKPGLISICPQHETKQCPVKDLQHEYKRNYRRKNKEFMFILRKLTQGWQTQNIGSSKNLKVGIILNLQES